MEIAKFKSFCFGYEAEVRTIKEVKFPLTLAGVEGVRVYFETDILTQKDFHGAFQKLLERYNKCIAAGGDYFERGVQFHVCTINKSAHTKKSLETYRIRPNQ